MFLQCHPICISLPGLQDLAVIIGEVLEFADLPSGIGISPSVFGPYKTGCFLNGGGRSDTYKLVMAVFGKKMKTQALLNSASSATSLLGICFANKCFQEPRKLPSLIKSIKH